MHDHIPDGEFVRRFIEAQFSLLPVSSWLRSPAAMKRFIKTNLPYAVHPADADRGEYIALNREYKPLGWPVDRPAFIDYGDPLWAPFCFYPSAASGLGDGFTRLYSADSPPWLSTAAMVDYIDRVESLFGCSGLRGAVWPK